jgi:bifunctional DNA-binding transcriptional regulator/antitoxin component of YhaV-PrlF toxin-antitoxin module
MNKSWIVTVDEDGVVPLPPEMLEEQDWREGDILDFDITADKSVVITNITAEERKRSV